MSEVAQLVVLLDDDAMITEALAAGLERQDRTVITCNDIESAELIVGRMQPTHVVTDVRLTGHFAFEGLDFIHFIKRHAPECRIVMISGDGSSALQREAAERGAAVFLRKPFEISELEAALDGHRGAAAPVTGDAGPLQRVPALDTIISSDALRPLFQPIVRLDGRRTAVGWESLARFRSESPMRDPELLFEYAERKRRVADLEVACMARTLSAAERLASLGLIFMNVHPAALASGTTIRDTLVSSATSAGIGLDQIVIEITEQASLREDSRTLETIDELRQLGVRFGFDDFGIAYSHLPLIGRIRPSFLKVSQHFGTGFEKDPTRKKIIANILALAAEFDSTVILEGIEEESTAGAASEMGITLGQGFLFGRPADAWNLLHDLDP